MHDIVYNYAWYCRTSVAVDNDLYYFIDEMYSVSNVANVSQVDLTKYPALQTLDTQSFLTQAAHQIEDFIDRYFIVISLSLSLLHLFPHTECQTFCS